MSNIPPDIYERVHELMLAIVNASEVGDEVLRTSNCEALRAYFVEQAAAGCSRPFLTEALADCTDATAEAVRLYELALQQAREFPGESTHTKMISLAEQLIVLNRTEQAEAYLRDGRAEAVRRGDKSWIDEADRLLRELAT